MFTNTVKRRPGRPAGETAQGAAARERLYRIAIARMAKDGYEATTLRDVAKEAGVSAGLLYRYFPSKRAVLIALYDELSAEFAVRAASIPAGRWRDRFRVALETSLRVLEPHRAALRGLIPVLVGSDDDGIFGGQVAFSRRRVQGIFEASVTGASDAPARPLGEALGRLLYLGHLAVLLWWLLDKSPRQRATSALVALMAQLLPSVSLTLRLPLVRRFVTSADALVADALIGSAR
jgi:AcrR family transcriptional regulator